MTISCVNATLLDGMKKLDNSIVLKRFEAQKTSLHKLKRLQEARAFYQFELGSPDLIYSLVMRNTSSSRILTPRKWGLIGSTYSLGAILDRLMSQKQTFEDLIKKPGNYHLDWMQRLVDIEKNFDYEKCSDLMLQLTNTQEQKECPGASFRIWDGVHRALALASLLKRGNLFFKPVSVLLMLDE